VTLEEAMRLKGLVPANGGIGRKCHCPSPEHPGNDANPSAMLNANNVYCFVCVRSFGLGYLSNLWGVSLEAAPVTASSGKEVNGVTYPWNSALFTYPFEVAKLG